MSGTIVFDTLAYSKSMQEAGFTQKQAEAMAEAQRQAFAQMVENRELATKGDLAGLRSELKNDMATMEVRLIKAIHNAMYGLVAAVAAISAVVVAILK